MGEIAEIMADRADLLGSTVGSKSSTKENDTPTIRVATQEDWDRLGG